MQTESVKRAFKFRFYPTDAQAAELSRTFGCVRKVYNLAVQARSEAWTQRQERVNYVQTSAMLTEWKKAKELAFLAEVSSVPLQQCLRHVQAAFVAFWEKRSKYPRFKSLKKSKASAEYTRSAFRYRNGRLTLAKMAKPLDVAWSRPLPEGAEPSTVTVRTWTCDGCGTTHDRDENAAKNVLAAGLAVSACGAGVRPQRNIPGGPSVMKQEISPRSSA